MILRLNIPKLIFIDITRIMSSLSGKTSSIHPSGHHNGGILSSFNNTRVPMLISSFFFNCHFDLQNAPSYTVCIPKKTIYLFEH
jgi:hypothetical protein